MWAAVKNTDGEKDWIEIGTTWEHIVGKSHKNYVETSAYPSWADTSTRPYQHWVCYAYNPSYYMGCWKD